LKFKFILLAVVVLLAGCSSKPSSTIDKIKESAGAGDIKNVYLFFDKPKITENLTRQVISQLESENNAYLRDNGVAKIRNDVEDIIKLRVWDVIDDEVRKGQTGSLSTMTIVKEDVNNKYNATLLIQLGHRQTTFQMSNVDNKWLITGLNLKDVVKNKMFKTINANPSFTPAKIKLISEYIDKYQDDKFTTLIKPELQKLVGIDYDTLTNNISVAGPIKKEGQFIVIDGLAPHSGGFDEGIIVVDIDNGILSAAIMKNGNKIDRYSDIQDKEDYPDLIKFWKQ